MQINICMKAYWCHILAWNATRNFEFELEIFSWDVEISSLPKSKFRVWTQNFQLGCRNFQFAEVEISSLNSKFPVVMSKFPVCRSRNFQFGSRNFQLGCRNFQFAEVEISSFNWKFPADQIATNRTTTKSYDPVWLGLKWPGILYRGYFLCACFVLHEWPPPCPLHLPQYTQMYEDW